MQDKTTAQPPEMDQTHRERACRLLFEIGTAPGRVSAALFLATYQAVLTKDLLWATNELLAYKQAEIHQ